MKNKARLEGSIAKAYNFHECLTFYSMYLQRVENIFNRRDRSDDGGAHVGISVFRQNVILMGQMEQKVLYKSFIDRKSSSVCVKQLSGGVPLFRVSVLFCFLFV